MENNKTTTKVDNIKYVLTELDIIILKLEEKIKINMFNINNHSKLIEDAQIMQYVICKESYS